ncbi:MAG: hypothetical protein KJ811_01880, partial [Candidatus Margulisbacteria bacterium]|nr:hypothetical protein [Candidatus Margulisiibacteriota bacterium]
MKVTLKLGNVFVSHNPQLEITQSLTRRAGLTTNQFDKIKTTLESIAKNLSRYGLPADKINISLDLQVGVSATEDTTSIGIDREAKTITVALSLADSHARSEQDIEEKLVNVAVVLSNMLVKSSEKESSRLIPFQTELEQFYKENQGVEGLIDQYNFCLSLDQLQTDFKLYQVAFDLVSPNIDAAPYCEAKVNSLLTMIKQIEKKLPAPHPFEQLTDLAFFAAL